jgi:hypothetical protein
MGGMMGLWWLCDGDSYFLDIINIQIKVYDIYDGDF